MTCGDLGDCVDMALDEMTVEPPHGRHREFQVDPVTGLQAPEGGPIDGLVDDISGEPPRTHLDRSQTCPVDRHRVADCERITDRAGVDANSQRARAALDQFDLAQLPDNPGKHPGECIDPLPGWAIVSR